jgi:hypothetical protein
VRNARTLATTAITCPTRLLTRALLRRQILPNSSTKQSYRITLSSNTVVNGVTFADHKGGEGLQGLARLLPLVAHSCSRLLGLLCGVAVDAGDGALVPGLGHLLLEATGLLLQNLYLIIAELAGIDTARTARSYLKTHVCKCTAFFAM